MIIVCQQRGQNSPKPRLYAQIGSCQLHRQSDNHTQHAQQMPVIAYERLDVYDDRWTCLAKGAPNPVRRQLSADTDTSAVSSRVNYHT